MKSSLMELLELKRELAIKIPIANFNKKTDKLLKKMITETKIDGFRKGMVPLSIIKSRFGAIIHNEVANEIVNETLDDALKEASITPATKPLLTKIDKQKDNFCYTVKFEVFPNIKLSNFSELTIEQIKIDITQKNKNEELDYIKNQLTEYKATNHKSKTGDSLTINFQGTINNKAFTGGTAKDFKLILGQGSMIKSFEEGLVGVVANQTLMLKLIFPKDYHKTQLAGKNAIFEITIKEVATVIELSDSELLKKTNKVDMSSLIKDIKQQMLLKADSYTDKYNKDAVFSALIKAHKFEIPEEFINNESQVLLQEAKNNTKQNKLAVKNIAVTDFKEQAKLRIKLGLLISKINKDNNLIITKEQIQAKLSNMMQSYGENAQQMINYYNKDSAKLKNIESLLMEQIAVNFILKQVKIKLNHKQYQEIFKNK